MDLDAAMMPPDQPTSPLNVLRWNGGEAYLITGAAGHWLAQRRDNGRTLAVGSPDELRGMLIRDDGDQPVPRAVTP
jgi:hypothetical protein